MPVKVGLPAHLAWSTHTAVVCRPGQACECLAPAHSLQLVLDPHGTAVAICRAASGDSQESGLVPRRSNQVMNLNEGMVFNFRKQSFNSMGVLNNTQFEVLVC